MIDRLQLAMAYEQALFAGRMDEVASYFTEDIVYWVAGGPPLGGEWHGRGAVIAAFRHGRSVSGRPTGATRAWRGTGIRPRTASSSRSASAHGPGDS
jgi:hypothetical protein